MALRIPKNLIVTSKYTSGGEYMFKSTQKEYKGYYYELNGNFFAGKEYKSNANELLKININNINPFLSRASTSTYGFLSNIKLNNISSIVINTLATDNDPNVDKSGEDTYYTRKINETPYSIKQIDEETYINTLKNPLQKSVILKADYSNIDQAEQQIPGLKAFLGI
jgi:hypothetical protein